MTFYLHLDRMTEILRARGRVSYRALKRELGLDDAMLADLVAELVTVQRVAVESDDQVLEWTGAVAETAPQPASRAHTAGCAAPGGAERRQVTVMFCDIVGSAGLAERLDPEDLRELLRRYHEAVDAIVRQCGGVIARYLGDGLLVYFGYPRAHEDDAARAVRAGLRIVDAVRDLSIAEALRVRIGLHTGMAVMGDIGAGDRRESMAAVGETPNIAARLQDLAEPGSVVLSEASHRLLRGAFDSIALGPQRLRGISGTIVAYRALRERPSWETSEQAAGTEAIPLVGRAREAALLARYWAQSVAGHGQTVLLQGEAGIGKSRLVRALDAHIAGQPHLRLKARGSAFHGNTAFHPVTELLHRALRVDPSLPGPERFERLRSALAVHGMPGDVHAQLLAPIFGIPLPGDDSARRTRTPERERQDTLSALLAFILGLAADRPLLLIVEDLHWIDASTLELLDRLIDEAPMARMLIVLTTRPEFGPRWADRPEVSLMILGRLGRGPIERIISAVAGGRTLPEAMVTQIASRTDGIPLFVEELTKMLLETDHLGDGVHPGPVSPPPPASIPASLQDSLIARLDHLPAGKATAQLGSVIGRQFSYAMLQAVAGSDEAALRHGLASLVDAELLYQRGEPPEASYTFKHALVQDAAYQMLLRSTRQEYHGRIARALEEQGDVAPEVLAHHYAGAGSPAEAIRCWHRAGEEANRRLAYVEAIGHFGSAIRLLQELPETPERNRQELALRTALGVPLVAAKGYGSMEAEDCYMRAYRLCLELDDRSRVFPAVRGLWNLRLVRAELERARELGDQLLDLAQVDGDPGKRVAAHRAMGVTLFKLGEYASASEHFRMAIDAYDPGLHAALAPEHGADPCVVCLAYLGTTAWALGYPDQALRHVQESLALARRLGHDLSVAVALTTASRFHQVRCEPARVREHATTVFALSEELGLPYWRALAMTLNGWAMAQEGNARGGIIAIQRGREALRNTGAGLIEPWNLAALADANLCAGEPGTALGLLTESLAVAHATGERWWEAEQHRLSGECTLARGGDSAEAEAEACFERALAVARRQQAKSLELRAAISLARLLRHRGRDEDARALLAPIYGWFSEGFDTPDLQKAGGMLRSSI